MSGALPLRQVLLLALLLLLSVMVQSQPQPNCYYVTTLGSQCPSSCAECQTLDWYCENVSHWIKKDTTLIFQKGIHLLDGVLMIKDSNNLIMFGEGNTLMSADGLPEPTVKINCAPNSGLLFSQSAGINMSNLHFESCGGLFHFGRKNVEISAALAFLLVQDVHINQIIVNNSKGYGLFTFNINGSNFIQNSAFLYTKMHPNTLESGNAKISFQHHLNETHLQLISSWFMYGENNQSALVAGGLNMLINSSIPVHVGIFNITAQGNSGTNGNLALYLMDYAMGSGSSVVINNSRIVDGRGEKGGGIRFWSHVIISHKPGISFTLGTRPVLTIIDSVFHNNSVTQTGGALYIAFYNTGTSQNYDGILRQVMIKNSNFTENGGNGAALEIIQHSLSHLRSTPLFYTLIENCTFEDNYEPPNVDGPIIDLIRVEVSISMSTFVGSNTTVMTLRDTILNLYDHILFANNSGVIGGALKLCDASLIFSHNGTDVEFIGNRARKGGAIYIQQACMDTSPLCFFQPSFPQGTPITEFENMIFRFVNNSAYIAGDAIYGGELDRCSTIVPFKQNESQENQSYLLFPHILDKVFDMQEHEGPSWISSNPQQVCFCQGSQTNNNRSCETEMESIEVYPGEHFAVSVITVGQMYGSTSGMINASLEDEQAKSHTLIKPKFPEMSSECTNMTFALHSNRDSAIIKLRPLTSELLTRYNITPVELNVKILQCPLGFELTKSPPYTCACSLALSKYLHDYNKLGYSPVICNITSREISVPAGRLWFGCYDQQYQNNTANCSSLVVTPNCNYYCNQENDIINVSISHLDSQCSLNHTGIMCGACKPGYSRILGNILECKKDCTNANLIILIPFFLVSGIILIIIIMGLNLTITEGTLNGLLVYTMVIQTHHSYFAEHNSSTFGKICWVFISWINLTFGIRACFYKDMDAYQYTWILFAHAFYLVSLLALIVYLTKRFIFFIRLFGRNIVKVLATIVFLLYSNIVFAIFIAFQYATLHYSAPNTTLHSKMVWYIDGNVPYLGRKHAPLYIVSLFWLMAVCFYVISLMLIQCLQRQPNVCCLRWIVKLKPFYDAYTGPCRDSYRFWPGFLLFMRTGLYIMNSTIPAYSVVFFQLKMLITAAFCVLIMSLACIFPHGVYKRWPLNILEFSFLLNLCITSGILGLSSHSRQRFYAVNTSVSISAFTFLGILVYHFYRRIKDTKLWRKFTTWLSVRSRISHINIVQRAEQSNEASEALNSSSDTERAFLLPQSLPSVVRFDECREPLVEA